MIKIIDSSKITRLTATSIPSDVTDILNLKADDEILWIFGENRNVILRRSSGIRPSFKELKPKELFIARNIASLIPKRKEWRIQIPKDIREMLHIPTVDRILWALDENANVIIMSPVLSNDCIKDILNNDLSAMVIYVTPLSGKGKMTFPKEIREFLDINHGDIITLNDTNGSVTITKSPISSINYSATVMGAKEDTFSIHLGKEIRDTLRVDIGDSILWIIDEHKNIIIRDSFLPDICLKPSKFVKA
jgi:bifunctional DNA-binding transcriptional regulator/antitoxin component of YhaV-PrlF toxin-antitoxin module